MDEEETEDVREAEEFVAQEIIPSENSVSPPMENFTEQTAETSEAVIPVWILIRHRQKIFRSFPESIL